jgi:hypothetical protein
MRLVVVALLCAVGFGSSVNAAEDWVPDAKSVAKVETAIRIPRDGRTPPPLDPYARYYAGKILGGRRIIEGMLLLPEASQQPGVYIRSGDKMPLGIMDGGCAEVRLRYDVAASKVLFIQCNGLA